MLLMIISIKSSFTMQIIQVSGTFSDLSKKGILTT